MRITTTSIQRQKPKLFVSLFLLFACVVIGEITLSPSTARAADPSDFKAGKIISDSIFTDSSSMSTSQIQNFLNSKVPSCDTNGQQNSEFGGPDLNSDGRVQRWEWGKHNYNQTKFTCLKNYSQGGKSAARIIRDAAQEFNISPKVLLVLLQKEQGLITDTWPLNLQYRSATGYGCPDTAACDSEYYGFTNQVRWAARMFRAIMNDSPTWYTPYELGNNSIPWHPNTGSCGYSTVNIQNRSTQALYNYTPYRPNSAALNAGYGTGNSCSSYGNRNFWLYFNDWFGSTTTAYDVEILDVRVYSDSARQNEMSMVSNRYNVSPEQTVYISVDVRNIGSKSLAKSFTKLGTTSNRDRASRFADESWLTPGRASRINEDTIAVNNNGSFDFSMRIPRDIGIFTENFGVVAESIRWINQDSVSLPFNITANSNYDITVISHQLYTDSAMTKRTKNSPTIRPDQKLYAKTVVKNIGIQDLTQTATKVAPTSPHDRTDSQFIDDSWLTSARIARIDATMSSGETGIFTYTLDPPEIDGVYTESLGFMAEGLSWMDEEKIEITINVREDISTIYSGEVLRAGEEMRAGGNKLVLQGDGNLVLYKNGRALWHTVTHNKGGNRLVLQGDGNLVLYTASGKPLWYTKTSGNGFSRLVVQGDGNLVIYTSGGRPTWWTGTHD